MGGHTCSGNMLLQRTCRLCHACTPLPLRLHTQPSPAQGFLTHGAHSGSDHSRGAHQGCGRVVRASPPRLDDTNPCPQGTRMGVMHTHMHRQTRRAREALRGREEAP